MLQRQGQPILLHQVAGVDFAARVKRGDAGYQSRPAVIIGIQKQPEADTVALTRKVEVALAEIQKTLPAGISATNVQFRQASFIETSIANVERVLLEAAGVVAVILLLFLMNIRATLISLTAIPVSILTTVLVFQAFGLTINTMTLGGLAIAIGELVDDAVVDVENILRRLKQNRESAAPRPVLAVIAAASQEVRSGIVYATAIIILVFIPLFALSGIEGRLFAPLGIAYIVSILASLIVSITLTPVMAYYLLSRAPSGHERDSFVVRHLKRGNAALLRWASRPAPARHPRRHRRGAGRLWRDALATHLPAALQRGHAGGLAAIQPRHLAGRKPPPRAARRTARPQVPEVKSIGRRTGRAELDEHAEGVHSSEVDIDLHRSDRPKERSTPISARR